LLWRKPDLVGDRNKKRQKGKGREKSRPFFLSPRTYICAMKLITFRHSTGPRPGLALDPKTGLDLLALDPTLPPRWNELFALLPRVQELGQRWAGSQPDPDPSQPVFSLAEVQLFPPVVQPSKIIGVGRNYRDHADEQKAKLPTAPLLFSKASTCLQSHNGPIVLTETLHQVDAEAELAVVIGRPGRAIPRSAVRDYIAGYTCFNDVSDRAAQFADKQWFRGKSIDTGGPCGPWIVTPDELPDLASGLAISCHWNQQLMQSSNTDQLLFPPDKLISYASQHMTLLPGDIIATGTPGGVGVFRDPPVFLRPGDLVEVSIAEIGTLANPVISA
jgi:2-keto-4-pentenoate hydratase/2-oxohepta-3-ene-1,7-dioic acid hydratase in catechol pathway